MRLNLREIINIPGKSVPFDFKFDADGLELGSVKSFSAPVSVVGNIMNRAGVLTVTGKIHADMECICARCLKEFPFHKDFDMNAYLAEELQDEDSEETYLLDGDWADLDEIVTTTIVLNTEQRQLCRPDCKGLCPKCGKDLNDGPCDCREDQDPRLAVLGQLLEKKD